MKKLEIKYVTDMHYRILLQLYKAYRINLYYESKNYNLDTVDDIKELTIVDLLRICDTCYKSMTEETIAKFGNSFEGIVIEWKECSIRNFIKFFIGQLHNNLEDHFNSLYAEDDSDMYDTDIYESEINFTMLIIKYNLLKLKIKTFCNKLMIWKK